LDANPANNRWKPEPRLRITPLYTSLDEADLTNDYDRWNFVVGPWVWGQTFADPWYTRSTMVGLRAAAFRTQKFTSGRYAALRTDFNDLVVGLDGVYKFDHGEIGANWERRIAGPWSGAGTKFGESAPNRAVVYARHVRRQTSSLYLPPLMYDEGFASYQDNFLPFARHPGGDRPANSWMGGYHFRLNLLTPYWDPECGVWVDLMAGGGQVSFERGGTEGMGQGRVELAAVKSLPDNWGLLRDSRVAARGVWMGALPERGQMFALGGGRCSAASTSRSGKAACCGSRMWSGDTRWRREFTGISWTT
jgi:hypothetical protein